MEAIRVLCEGSTSSGPARPGQALPSSVRWTLVVALRLLHVLTGLARYNIAQVWTAETKGMIDGFLTSLLRLAVVRFSSGSSQGRRRLTLLSSAAQIHAGTVTLDKELFELLMDSLWAFLEGACRLVVLSTCSRRLTLPSPAIDSRPAQGCQALGGDDAAHLPGYQQPTAPRRHPG